MQVIEEADYLTILKAGRTTVVRLDREDKRNALSEGLMRDLRRCLDSVDPVETGAIVICGKGKHFCAGLDLAEHKRRDGFETIQMSRFFHETLDRLEFGPVPAVAALQGAVIGGGLEIATACHVRVASHGTFYQLPEGRLGTFVGGGATLRVQRILGVDRMREMMLTGRKYGSEEGQRYGLSHYLVDQELVLEKALELADHVAGNARISNYMMINAIPRIADMDRSSGSFAENLAAAISQVEESAQLGADAFLEKREIRYDQ